ncbi:Cys-tRNA(Pro)/Cys-tRNA(Cys) deacylase [Peribacillus deserti]|uniref:Cys-tRNA(Pro)/Cys-tRNA(Cys) deacylase n=1 Tax=Peribacillus deserti TaxID=673318 RepID=A0ABS2QBQ1_9BACI|nr:Cys-tRNA(Pro) deacylase [Peribacillus deserti]MBM7690607.1 Cys-tRNA(Pro)/Cys-tRNA(Cys) deacylase [Peribacillus deserti]
MVQAKTNAMRILDKEKIDYQFLTYENKDGKIDGISVANKIGKPHELVFKTLVTIGKANSIHVFVIPVEAELDFKKAAKAAAEKKLDMLPVKDIQKWTGYIRGGCSPVGMKKLYPTYIDSGAEGLEKIIVSGGKIGVQLEMDVDNLVSITRASLVDLVQ